MTLRLLDLFCCQGGAGEGYRRAGFDVYGVDIDPQPLNPHPFVQTDALHALTILAEGGRLRWGTTLLGLSDFAAIHASPPCQAHTTMSAKHRGKGGLADEHVSLIAPTRELLIRTGLPYVIENVPGAKRHLVDPTVLHGGMFGLGVDRPRLFESNVPLSASGAPRATEIVGVYGKAADGRRLWTRSDGSILRAAKGVEEARRVMGIDWMDWRGLAEAIPPAYTQYIGRQLMTHVLLRRAGGRGVTTWPREWVAAMPGDVVRDGGGRAWTVTQTAPAGAGASAGVWVELDGEVHSRDARGVASRGRVTVHVPAAGVLVELDEGPGWGDSAQSEQAMSWASALVGDVLGASGHEPQAAPGAP